MLTNEPAASSRWAQAWPDALAFAAGLAVAWYAGWATTDLVWSLWLSSLVVGYAMIVWTIFSPAMLIGREAYQNHTIALNGKTVAVAALGGTAYLIGALFMLAFFTVHFGMFHLVHSMFLSLFFPLDPAAKPAAPGLALYLGVFSRYWIFLPVAFVAERKAFAFPKTTLAASAPVVTGGDGERDVYPDGSVTAAAIAARRAGLDRKNSSKGSGGAAMMAPYKNVMRMHLLIFFFAFAHFARLENFWIYAVVYAAYFFPWRLVRGAKTEA